MRCGLLLLLSTPFLASSLTAQVQRITPRDEVEGHLHPACGGYDLRARAKAISDTNRALLVQTLRDERARFDSDHSMLAIIPLLKTGVRVLEVTDRYVHLRGPWLFDEFCVPLKAVASYYRVLPKGQLVAIVPARYLHPHTLALALMADNPDAHARSGIDQHEGSHTNVDYGPPLPPGRTLPTVPRTSEVQHP